MTPHRLPSTIIWDLLMRAVLVGPGKELESEMILSPKGLAARLSLLITIIVTALYSSTAVGEEGLPDMFFGTQGTCESLVVAGRQYDCHNTKGILLIHLTNGVAMLVSAFERDQALTFIGDRDSQAVPDVYRLYVSRIRLSSNDNQTRFDATGSCIIHSSRDGQIWSRVDCSAVDSSFSRYELHFLGDGSRVDASRP